MLEARSITFSYPQAKTPLYRDFSFIVHPYERVALCAPSGFGKTTLCRLLAGYDTVSRGEILVDGQPLPRRGVCPVQMVWQHPELAVDARMRMSGVLQEAGEVPIEILEGLGIKRKWLTRYPHELSGGELQRFCIARALTVSPRYLIADEISTMLDAVTQVQIWNFLCQYTKQHNIGLVFVSHSPALRDRIATRVADLESVRRGGG